MPNIRLVLWGLFAAILFLNYQTWMHDYEPAASKVAETRSATGAPASTLGESVPQAAPAVAPSSPAEGKAAAPAASPPSAALQAPNAAADTDAAAGGEIQV